MGQTKLQPSLTHLASSGSDAIIIERAATLLCEKHRPSVRCHYYKNSQFKVSPSLQVIDVFYIFSIRLRL